MRLPIAHIDKYIHGAKRRIKESKNIDKRIWRIVMGHTHQEGLTKDYTVFNFGSWVADRPSFAEVDEKKNIGQLGKRLKGRSIGRRKDKLKESLGK